MSLDTCRIIDLPRLDDDRGSLTFIEPGVQIPFRLERVYYLYDVPRRYQRGGHAHIELEQLVVAMNGAIDITLDDGRRCHTWTLNRPDQGLYVAPMMWRTLQNFTDQAVCCIFASQPYDEDDYIHDYQVFLHAVGARP